MTPDILSLSSQYKSLPNLRHITSVDGGRVWDYAITSLPAMLGSFTKLETVKIAAFDDSGDDIDLTWIMGFAHQCPNLKSLEVAWALGMTEPAVKLMVHRRIEAGHPLDELIIELDDGVEPSKEWVDWLKARVPRLDLKRHVR